MNRFVPPVPVARSFSALKVMWPGVEGVSPCEVLPRMLEHGQARAPMALRGLRMHVAEDYVIDALRLLEQAAQQRLAGKLEHPRERRLVSPAARRRDGSSRAFPAQRTT